MNCVIVAIIKDEQLYLKEWIDYNLSIGFSHIYLFEDFGSTSHKEICDQYDSVTLKSISDALIVDDTQTTIIAKRQQYLYESQLESLKGKADWVAFIDVDEFIDFCDGYNLLKLVEDFKDMNAIYLYWKVFNANGQIYYEDKPVRLRFTNIVDRASRDWMAGLKSIVNLNNNEGLITHHTARNGVNTKGMKTVMIRCYRKAFINHYFTKSLEEWSWRFTKKGDVANCYRLPNEFFKSNEDLEYILDNPPQFWQDCLDADFANRLKIYNTYIDDNNINKLQIGCGGNVLDNWFNTDIDCWSNDVYYIDATKKMPLYDSKFNFAYSEHLVEHLTRDEALVLFNEIHRVLKDGGVFRISLPTQDFFNRLKNENHDDYINFHFMAFDPFEKNKTIDKLILNYSTMWKHKVIYEKNDLINILKLVGFKEINEVLVNESIYSELLNIEHHGDFIGEEYNKLESTVLECIK